MQIVYVPMTYLITYAHDHIGITVAAATWGVSIVGITSTVARVLIAPVCDALPKWHISIYILNRIICGASVFLLPYTNSLGTLYAACAVFGFTSGSFIAEIDFILFFITFFLKFIQGCMFAMNPVILYQVVEVHKGKFTHR